MSQNQQFTNTIVPVNSAIPVMVEGDLQVNGFISGSVKSNITDIILHSTGSNTTASLSYGINVIASSSLSDFCSRLPSASKGQIVTVINPKSTGNKARILPSQTGGSINGLTNGFFDVPNDALAYNFICYENPAPGGWSTSQPLNVKTIVSSEFIIPHTFTTSSFYVGNTFTTKSPYGGSLTGVNYENINFTPSGNGFWDTIPSKAVATKLRIYTNVLASDFSNPGGDPNEQRIDVFVGGFYKNAPNGSISGDRSQWTVYSSAPTPDNPDRQVGGLYYIDVVGYPAPLAGTPPQIGDLGTLYGESIPFSGYGSIDGLPVGGLPIGLGGPYGPHYYIFCVDIGDRLATKTYRFRIELDYVEL